MDAQKEALRRIISTLTNKNQELKDLLQTLDWTRTGLQAESCHVMSELEAELEQLRSALEERGAELRMAILQSQQTKEAALQLQQGEGQSALEANEELLTLAKSALHISDDAHFLQAAKEIKERVTMAAAFRISTRPLTSPHMSHFAVDFSAERVGLSRLHFLPVPPPPLLDLPGCFLRDNCLFVKWSPVGQSGVSYELQYRKCESEAPPPAPEASWERIQGIKDTHSASSGLRFDCRFVEVRVRALNKAAAGDFSPTLLLETHAFDFGLDPDSAHPELSVQRHSATWSQRSKVHQPRVQTKTSRGGGVSPVKSGGRGSRERFAGESYTVLGDQEISGGGHYWEVRPMGEWKSFSVGVAYRGALSRFVQMGKTPASWCLSLSQWLQPSVSAKHNNKSKSLDPTHLPTRVGLYCHHSNGDLVFVDVDRKRLIHLFKTKFSQSLVPAFTVWFGGVAVETGLQVPSFIGQLLPTTTPISAPPPLKTPPHPEATPSPEDVQLSPASDKRPGSDLSPDQSPDSDPETC